MSEHSFDIVSKVNLQELRNGVQQAQKEVATRFDFQRTSAGIEFEEPTLTLKLTADHAAQMNSVINVIESKLAKRGVSLKSLAWKETEALPSGGVKRQGAFQQGLDSDRARAVVKHIKDLGLKIQPRIDGDAVRVSGKQIDDLQAVAQSLKTRDFGIAIQVENYR